MATKGNILKTFKVQPHCLRLFGIWPGADNTFQLKQICVAVVNVLCIICVMSCEYRFTFTYSGDLRLLIENLFVVNTRMLALIKILIMIWKRKELQALVKMIVDLVENDKDPCSKRINQKTTKLEFYCISGMHAVFGIALISTVSTPILKWLISGQNMWEVPFMVR
jgi:hypothetical protein